jgi:hypothetical protein
MRFLYVVLLLLVIGFLYSCKSPVPDPIPVPLLGPELVVNGTFDSTNLKWESYDWSSCSPPFACDSFSKGVWYSTQIDPMPPGAVFPRYEGVDGWFIRGGVAEKIAESRAGAGLFQMINVFPNKLYRITFDIIGKNPSGIIRIGDYNPSHGIDALKSGNNSFDLSTANLEVMADYYLMIDGYSLFSIDNVSVKEIL